MSEEFYNAVYKADFDTVRQMLAADPKLIHSRFEWEYTPLHGAAAGGNSEMAELLLDAGADPNAKAEEGITPLHVAFLAEVIELLVQRGANVDLRSDDGSTPLLMHAAAFCSYEAMEALLKCGADPKATDALGQTAYDIAQSQEEREKRDKTSLLRQYGALK